MWGLTALVIMDSRSSGNMNPIKGQRGFQLSQFCPKGHNTFITGRTAAKACRPCKLEYNNRYKKENYIKTRRQFQKHNWTKAGIINLDGSQFSYIDFDRHYQIQQGRCLMCKRHQSELSTPLCTDHDHKTKLFRGLLCHSCNVALGLLGDSMETLHAGIVYLKGDC